MNLTHEEAQQMHCCSYNQNCHASPGRTRGCLVAADPLSSTQIARPEQQGDFNGGSHEVINHIIKG